MGISTCLHVHMFFVASSRGPPAWKGKKGTCYFLASAQCCCERLDRARVFSYYLQSLICLIYLTHSASHPLTHCSLPIRSCLIHKHFFAAVCGPSPSSFSSLACLAGLRFIFLATTTGNYTLLLGSIGATMSKRKAPEPEVREVYPKSSKKSRTTMNMGMCVRAFPILSSAMLHIERMEKAGWLAG